MQCLTDNLWTQSFPLSVFGTEHGRTTTVIRLPPRELLIHSMAPFSSADLSVIRELGSPAWLVESMLLHDTYAKEGRAAFPTVPFFGPPGFSEIVGFESHSLEFPPPGWGGQIRVLPIGGAPRLKEFAFVHVPSRTLIVADLIFNFRPDEKGWDRFFHRYLAGFKRYPGMSRIFRWAISDTAAFKDSIEQLLDEDFDRIIVGHGRTIPTGGKAALEGALRDAKLL